MTGLYPPGTRAAESTARRSTGRSDSLLPEILKKQGLRHRCVHRGGRVGCQVWTESWIRQLRRSASQKEKEGKLLRQTRRDTRRDIIDSAISWLSQARVATVLLLDPPVRCSPGPYDSRPEIFEQKFADHPYDAGIAREIQQFERLITFLKERKIDKTTLVVVVADHGEGLDEHLESEHGMMVYNTTLHTPFVFVGQRFCQPGTRVATPVSLADLTAPDDPGHPREFRRRTMSVGEACVLHCKGESIGSRDCYAETHTPYVYNHWSPLHTIISDRWKYIHTTRPELF